MERARADTRHLSPAKEVIAKLGGVRAVAEVVGRAPTAVYRWMYERDRGGTGGLIPSREAERLLGYAKANDLDLKADDFFRPATEEAA